MKGKVKIIIGTILIVILLAMFRTPIFIFSTMEKKQITVEKTYIKRINDKDIFFVETKEGEKLRNEDCVWIWKLNSADLDTELKEDSTYTVKVYGIRSNLFSWYKNVASIEK